MFFWWFFFTVVYFFFSATDCWQQDWQMEFVLQEMCDEIKRDGFIKIVSEQVLNIGKNSHLLRLLGKLHLVDEVRGELESGKCKEKFFCHNNNHNRSI